MLPQHLYTCKVYSKKQLLLVGIFAFALLTGSAYNLYLSYDSKSNVDCRTYMAIANGEFKDQSLTRRYRILVPFIAKAVSLPIESVYSKLWAHRSESDWPLKMGFLITNLILMSAAGCAIYLLCKAYSISEPGSLLAMIAVLCGGRWGNLLAGTPITDSLYLLVLTLTILAIKTRNDFMLAICILIGPLAKESFIFVAPFIFFFAPMHKWKQLLLFAVAGSLAFGIRYQIDQLAGSESLDSIVNDANHIENISYSLTRILSVRGIGELGTVLGIFSFILLAGLTKGKTAIKSWSTHVDSFLWWFILIMLIHALLSSEVSRMLYLGSAVWAVMIGLIWDKHPLFSTTSRNFKKML